MSMATRVMIIEDDLAIAELHHKYLSQLAGLEVVGIATTRMEAEMQLDILKPDLLLMDVYLPDGTGLEILNTLRANNQTLIQVERRGFQSRALRSWRLLCHGIRQLGLWFASNLVLSVSINHRGR